MGSQADYYDPRNSFLNEVLDRKIGIPITLALVYIGIAQSCGWELYGVNFPGHFLTKYVGEEGEKLFLDFRKFGASSTTFKIPANSRIIIKGANGKIKVDRPQYHLDIRLTNGKVDIDPDLSRKYHFKNSVVVGKVDDFPSVDSDDALKINVSLTNG